MPSSGTPCTGAMALPSSLSSPVSETVVIIISNSVSLRTLAAGNDAAMDACDRLATLWGNPQPPKENVFAVLGQAILGKMILGRNK